MVYRRSKTNIRRPVRRRRIMRKRVYKRKTTRRRTQTQCECPGDLSPTARFALAQIDPFEPRCQGAKVPDSNTIPSIANVDQDQVSFLTSPTAGHTLNAYAFLPSYAYGSVQAQGGAGLVTWPTTGAQRRNYGSILTNVEAIRPVSHAIRMSSSTAPTTTVGFVHVGLAVESRRGGALTGAPDLPTNVNEMTGLPHYKRFTIASLTQSPVTVINKWIDETAFRYDDPSSLPLFVASADGPLYQHNINFNQSWGTIVVMTEGAQLGTNVIGFEHLLLSECIPKRTAFVLGTQAAPNSPGTMSAVSTMQSGTDFSHTEAEQESYISQSLNELGRGARIAGAQVFNNVALPLVQRLGGHVANTGLNMAFAAMAGRGGLPGINSNPNRGMITRI